MQCPSLQKYTNRRSLITNRSPVLYTPSLSGASLTNPHPHAKKIIFIIRGYTLIQDAAIMNIYPMTWSAYINVMVIQYLATTCCHASTCGQRGRVCIACALILTRTEIVRNHQEEWIKSTWCHTSTLYQSFSRHHAKRTMPRISQVLAVIPGMQTSSFL